MTALVAPLDAVRARMLRIAGRLGRKILADRATRVAVYGVAAIAAALVTTCAAPLWLFALGPILLGIPHLVADVRYLVIRPALGDLRERVTRESRGLAGRTVLLYAVGPPLFATLLVPSAHIGLTVGFGVIAVAHTTTRRRVLAAMAWTIVYAAALSSPRAATMIVLHGHNFFAVALFLVVFARNRAMAAIPAALFVIASVAMVLGAFDPVLLRPFAVFSAPTTALSIDAVVSGIAPLADPMLALRLTFLFVFAQSVHYAVWLRLVPEEARERPGIRSFASSFQALSADLGPWLLGASVVAAVALLAAAASSLEIARMGYLRASAPHAYLEIAFALLWVLERGTGLPARKSVLGAGACSSRRGTSTASVLDRNAWPNGSPSGSPTSRASRS